MKCFLSFVMVLAGAASAFGQQAVMFEGRLVNSVSGDPIPAATVVMEELKREAVSGQDGTFRFENVAPGSYHLFVRTTGYSSRRTEVAVPGGGGGPVDVRVDPDLHFQEVASVNGRGAQPVRCVSADVGSCRTGADQTARRLARRDAREVARRGGLAASARRPRGRSSAAWTATAC